MNAISVCALQCSVSPSSSATFHCSPRSHGSTPAMLCRSKPFSSAWVGLGLGGRRRSGSGSGAALDFRAKRERESSGVVCAGLWDFWGGDLLGFDLDQWYRDVEDYGSIAVYAPPEGGYEGRYATRLKQEGYLFMNISARGLGDPEAYLTKIHGVRPAHLGKQAIECFYLPPEVDYRLAALPKECKGLVLWVLEAKVLSKTELQYLALLPALRKNLKVIAECGSWRKFRWKPLRVAAGLPTIEASDSTKVAKTADSEALIKVVAETGESPKETEIKPQTEAPKVAKTAGSEAPKVVAETAESPKETESKPQVEKEPRVEKEPPVEVSV